MAGTPAYLAPEFSRVDLPQHLLQRSDIYSLGVIAYEMLTGSPPYDIVTTQDMLARTRAPPPLPSQLRPELTAAFDDAVAVARCASTRSRRTASADELRTAAAARARVDHVAIIARCASWSPTTTPTSSALARETLAYGLPGREIETVADGEAALAAIDREPASLAVIDLDMPGLNGVELTAALRANYSMPIVVCTASGGAPDWRLLSALGADGFLVKPIDPFALIALARKMLDGKKGAVSVSGAPKKR